MFQMFLSFLFGVLVGGIIMLISLCLVSNTYSEEAEEDWQKEYEDWCKKNEKDR